MRLRRVAFSTLIACGLLAGGAGAAKAQDSFAAGVHIGPSGHPSVDLAYFHNELTPYGRWVNQSVYGDVFVPHVRYSHWRPYEYGRWVYTDYGWTWVSAEPFGWATYHYGRWAYDPDYGWIWVPGTEWGPAWVAWQQGDDYVGWAALPPTVGFDAGVGLDFGAFQVGVDIAPVDYVFVPQRSFLVSNIGSYCLPVQQNVAIFGRTRNITNYGFVGGRVINRAFPVTTAQQWTGRQVPRYQVADARSFTNRPRFQGNRMQMFRPAVNAPRNARTAERIAAENRGANAPARLAERRAAQARMAAVAGRNTARTGRQQIASRAQEQRVNERARARNERQQIAARAQTQRQNERVQARNQRQQIAARASEQRQNQRARAQAQRQQIAARNQANATRNRERAQAQASRNQQRAQAARNQERAQARSQQRAQAQASRNQQRAQAQADRGQQRAQARAQQRPPRQQVAQQQQRGQQHRNRPPQQGGQDQRRPHGGV